MQHNFTVAVPVDVAWSALLDPQRVAPCMPGATLSSADETRFSGSIKVKLGPISLLYKGTGTFTEVDVSARRVVIDASGKDSRGNGTASATVTAVLTDHGESTDVRVDTDMKVTGRPAQLGRGLISEVGGRILDQFAACLAQRLAPESAEAEPETEAGTTAGAAAQGGAPQADGAAGEESTPAASTRDQTVGDSERAAAAARHPSRTTGGRPAWRVTSPRSTDHVRKAGDHTLSTDVDSDARAESNGSAQRAARKAIAGEREAARRAPEDSTEAIDLLGTAGLPVAKRLAPVVAGLVVVAAVIRILRRRRRA